MTVKMTLRKEVYEVKAGMTLRHALIKSDLQPEAFLAVRNGELITEDEILHEGENIKLIAVISGGCC